MIRYRIQCWACQETEFFKDYSLALHNLNLHVTNNKHHVVTLERLEAAAETDAPKV